MPKRKKKHAHTPPADTKAITTSIFDAIVGAGKKATLKKILPKLVKRYSYDEILLAIHRLDQQGKIHISSKGKIHLRKFPSDELTKQIQPEAITEKKSKAARCVFGIIDITRSGAGYVTADGFEKDIYIPRHFVRDALQGDEVKVRLIHRGSRLEGEVIQVVKRSQDTFTGKIEILEKIALFIADDRKPNLEVYIPNHLLKGAKHNQRVIARVTNWHTGAKHPEGEVLELIYDTTGSDLAMKKILITNGFSIDFPSAVYRELEKFSDKIPDDEIRKRLDYRAVTTFTIDPEDAKDFDDALSVNYLPNNHIEIGVHIADVSYYVTEGSELDKEAERRGTSVYLPDRVCPMLPEKLSNYLCSLRPNEDKLTYSVLFEINKKGQIIQYTLAKTIIRSKRRFTYEEVQHILETGEGEYAEELKILHRYAQIIRSRRMKAGAIAFEKPEVRFRLDEKGKPIEVVLKIRKDAHLLVEDFMLLANETVAQIGSKLRIGKQRVPFVYRVHDKPDPAKLEQFSAIAARFGYHIKFKNAENAASVFNALLKRIEGKPEQNVLETLAIRSMAKAEYTTENIGHYGLAMKYYTHFTSPIRRYPDLLAHRILYEITTGSDKIIDRDELETRCRQSSLMERKAMDAEREAIKYKQIEYLQDKIGQIYDGIISGVTHRGIYVELIENKCEGMVSVEALGNEDFVFDERQLRLAGTRSGKRYQMGDRVKVRLLNADTELQRVDLELISYESAQQ